jgi:hypothetical protein
LPGFLNVFDKALVIRVQVCCELNHDFVSFGAVKLTVIAVSFGDGERS